MDLDIYYQRNSCFHHPQCFGIDVGVVRKDFVDILDVAQTVGRAVVFEEDEQRQSCRIVPLLFENGAIDVVVELIGYRDDFLAGRAKAEDDVLVERVVALEFEFQRNRATDDQRVVLHDAYQTCFSPQKTTRRRYTRGVRPR